MNSSSVRGVMRYIGAPLSSSSSATWISKRLKELGIETSHFTGQGWSKGQKANNRKKSEEYLVLMENCSRLQPYRLRRAMREAGIEEKCKCGIINEWNGLPIQLEIDHINGNCLDNRKENLAFICPNCHSQQETSNRRKSVYSNPVEKLR